MKRTNATLCAVVLMIGISSTAFAGTIVGARTSRTGTIVGARGGTIVGARTGNIVGARTENIADGSTIALGNREATPSFGSILSENIGGILRLFLESTLF